MSLTVLNKPRLAMRTNRIELALDLLTLLCQLSHVALLLCLWDQIPSRVPMHFNAVGRPDHYTGRNLLALLPVSGLFLWGATSFVRLYPHLSNFAVPITEENCERQYRLLRLFIGTLNLEISATLLYLTTQVLHVALGHQAGLGLSYLYFVVGMVLLTIAGYVIRSVRAR